MTDLLLHGFDLQVVDGDFAIGNPTAQNIELLLISQKSEWKQHPQVGVGLADWLKGETPAGLKAEIKRQLKADGMKINTVKVLRDGALHIDATY